MSYGALHFSGQQNSPSFRQFSVSAPQHLPQLCTTQQKPREAESWASVAYHAMLCTPVMSQCLEGWKPGQKKMQTLCWQGHLKYSGEKASGKHQERDQLWLIKSFWQFCDCKLPPCRINMFCQLWETAIWCCEIIVTPNMPVWSSSRLGLRQSCTTCARTKWVQSVTMSKKNTHNQRDRTILGGWILRGKKKKNSAWILCGDYI